MAPAARGDELIEAVLALSATGSQDMASATAMRKSKEAAKEKVKAALAAQTPLKWVDRVIMWCADMMPSFTAGIEGSDAGACVDKAKAADTVSSKVAADRTALIKKYGA